MLRRLRTVTGKNGHVMGIGREPERTGGGEEGGGEEQSPV